MSQQIMNRPRGAPSNQEVGRERRTSDSFAGVNRALSVELAHRAGIRPMACGDDGLPAARCELAAARDRSPTRGRTRPHGWQRR
jgi:hypothetical protein